ncbi:MAG: M15 family metallopeptidase [Defluviitaleaceae bacterium]|nr:M15 family metallopeptidase [Defluviitaleaceae bacterium]
MNHDRYLQNQKRRPVKKNRRGCSPRPWTFVVLILALGIGIYTIVSGMNQPEFAPGPILSSYEGISDTPEEDYDTSETETEEVYNEAPLPLPMVSISTRDISNTGYLILVNHQYPATGNPDSSLLTAAWPTVAVSRVDDMYLHHSALRAVSEMFASARTQDVTGLFVSSAFRDFYRQAYIFGDGSNSAYVMPPGHSEHQTGLAADILIADIGMAEMAHSPQGRWMADNSYRYGLILRYPQGMEHVTGINFEPWHFRYVGQIHAYYIMKRGFVLEEYIRYIHNQGHFSFEKNDETHHIIFQLPQNGMIYVPYGRDFTISADNKGGYIIWTTE